MIEKIKDILAWIILGIVGLVIGLYIGIKGVLFITIGTIICLIIVWAIVRVLVL